MTRERLNQLLVELDSNSIVRFEGSDIDLKALKVELQSQSLFTNPTVVVSNISEQKSLHEDMVALAESLSDEAELIIYEPAIDKRSKYYKFLLNHTVCDEYKALDSYALAQWLVQRAEDNGGKIDRSSALYLIERVGDDQWLLANELDKLLLAKKPIDKSLIDEMVEPTMNENVFKLLDAITSKNAKQAGETYQKLVDQKLDPQYIISMLVWQLHILAIMVFAGSRGADEVAKDAKISPFVAKKTAQVAKNVSKDRLKEMLEMTAKLDAELKSQPVDAVEGLRLLIAKLSRA